MDQVKRTSKRHCHTNDDHEGMGLGDELLERPVICLPCIVDLPDTHSPARA